MKSLSIIVVNYKSREFLSNCIRAIFDSEKSNYTLNQIVIVNNDEKSLLINTIDKIKIVEANKNLGFGKACNLAVKNLDYENDYLLFLNPDTEVSKKSISQCIDKLEKDEKIAVCGAANCNENNKPYRTCENINTFKDIFVKSIGLGKLRKLYNKDYNALNETVYVGHVIGAFYLIKEKIFKEVRGFDERFFVYYEDMDLSKRVNDLGYKILFNSDAKVKHIGGGSSSKVKTYRMFYSYSSGFLYLKKHYGLFKAKLFSFFVYSLFLPLRIFKAFCKLNMQEAKDIFSVYKLYFSRKYK